MENYILNDRGQPIVEPDIIRWATWYETADRTVALSQVSGVSVSTVFLAIDHGAPGAPLLYETMAFGPSPFALMARRYATRVEAEAGHAEVCEQIRQAIHSN